MSSLFPLSAQCQLTRNDLEQMLLLPERLTFATGEVVVPASSSTSSSSSSSSVTVKATVGGVACAFLTMAHIRQVATNALVRVHVPKNKRAALIEANPFVKLAQAEAEALKASSPPRGAGGQTRPEGASGTRSDEDCRVGRLVALLQRPSPRKPPTTRATAGDGDVTSWTDCEQAQLDGWLVAVHLGDCVEPLALRYMSNEPFTEAEHRVYVQTTTQAQEAAALATSASPAGSVNALLTAEQAAAVKANVMGLRDVLEVVYRTTTARAQEVLSRLGQAAWGVAQRTVGGVKREREDDAAAAAHHTSQRKTESDASVKTEVVDESIGHDGEGSLLASLGGGRASHDARLAQLIAENAQAHAQLQAMRQLLTGKDAEVKRQMQKQRQAEQASEAAAEQMRAKLEDEGRARRREREEAEVALKAEKEAKDTAQTTIKRLVDALRRFQSVTTEVAAMAGLPAGTAKPEEVLAALKGKRLS